MPSRQAEHPLRLSDLTDLPKPSSQRASEPAPPRLSARARPRACATALEVHEQEEEEEEEEEKEEAVSPKMTQEVPE